MQKMAALLNLFHMCLRCVDVSLHNVCSDKEENVKTSSNEQKQKKKNENEEEEAVGEEEEAAGDGEREREAKKQLEFMYKKRGITSIVHIDIDICSNLIHTYTGAHAQSGPVHELRFTNCDSLNKIDVVLVTDWY